CPLGHFGPNYALQKEVYLHSVAQSGHDWRILHLGYMIQNFERSKSGLLNLKKKSEQHEDIREDYQGRPLKIVVIYYVIYLRLEPNV
ncbi:hypothetical protein BpHYR1_021087, partial [Brachionus plicatilis]